jgi:hypothetical protein
MGFVSTPMMFVGLSGEAMWWNGSLSMSPADRTGLAPGFP